MSMDAMVDAFTSSESTLNFLIIIRMSYLPKPDNILPNQAHLIGLQSNR